nr:MAG TPA: helix-turn-helix domain protein [Caudoviricetes sp.]
MSVGSRIREFRKRLGLSVDDVAEKLGKNRATIYRYESDDIENLPAPVLEPLAKVLQTTPAELMGWEQPPISASDDLPTVSPTGQKVDARTRRQLEKVLDDDNLTYNGVVLNGEDKEKVKKALELIFWDIKEKNKRKK